MDALLGEYGIEALKLIGTALGALGAREFAVRVRSRTKVTTAEDDAQVSVLDGALQREADLRQQLDAVTAERDTFKAEAVSARLTIVKMIAEDNPQRALEIARDSGFADVARPLRARPAPRPPAPSHDRFQATKPFEPPPPPRARRDAPADPGSLRMLDPDEYLKDRK